MRAQTNLDFAMGVSVFITVLIFIFAFAPGILAPFTGGSQEETVASERIADQLSQGLLGSPREPYVLDRTCTVAFFEGRAPDASGEKSCRYYENHGGSYTVEDRIGVSDRTRVNVTIEADLDDDGTKTALCWDDGDRGFEEKSTGNCDNDGDGTIDDTLLIGGDLQPASNDVVTARRTVSLGNRSITHNATMYVHVS